MLSKQWLQRTLFILLIGVVSSQWGGNENRKKETCNKPSLKNGKIKLRSNGRVVKYSCYKDFILVGESTSTCLQGEWTADTPVCATRGCPMLPNPTSGRFVPSNAGAVLRLECNPGYFPSDSPMLYCDRFEWNATSPTCQPSRVVPSFSCDFEQDDLCGWSQDASDEFDWTWQSYTTPSYHLGTGPSFDHTLGANKGGHYLFIESSSPRSLNDTARLYSPVYGPPSSGGDVNSSNEQCFTFWYHMYGSDSGRLHVYVKAESVAKLSQVKPTFVRVGDQGNIWRQGYLPLTTSLTVENFQVVIEGVRGTGYVGDTAIDDVQLVSGADCQVAKERMLAEKPGPSTSGSNRPSTLPPKMSCFSRCSSTTASSNADLCGCRDDCLLTNSCCSDYATFCLTDGVQGDESAVPGASRIKDDGTSQSSRNRDRQQQPAGMAATIGGGVGGCILLISAVALIGVYVRHRRFLHRIGSGGQQQQQDLLAEDSDIRYLKDEDDVQLDLTEATPSSTRQFSNFERL